MTGDLRFTLQLRSNEEPCCVVRSWLLTSHQQHEAWITNALTSGQFLPNKMCARMSHYLY